MALRHLPTLPQVCRAGLAINSSGVISGTITAPGSFLTVVTVFDGSHTASQAFSWTVTGPVFLADPGNEINTYGDVVYLPLAAIDPEGETLSYSATGLPTGLSINTTTGIISGTVSSSASTSSPYSVTITATDTSSHSTSQTFDWSIAGYHWIIQARKATQRTTPYHCN